MTPPPKLQQGSPDDDYPLNEMGAADFNVGGVRRILPDRQQLEQLDSYLSATYQWPDFAAPWEGGAGDAAAVDRFVARLPDRITHAAMLMLGSAVDHTMPGVAFAGEVETEEVPELNGLILRPSAPSGRWAVSLHPGGWWRGSGAALDFAWRPEVAAAAELSGTTILDLDYPLLPAATLAEVDDAVTAALAWVRAQDPVSVTAWGHSSGAALAAGQTERVDALVLSFPDLGSAASIPAELRAGFQVPAADRWPRSLVQLALDDDVAARPEALGSALVEEYVSTHRVSTPQVARERITAVAEFLRSVGDAREN